MYLLHSIFNLLYLHMVIIAILPLLTHFQYFSFERMLDSCVTLCIFGDSSTNLFIFRIYFSICITKRSLCFKYEVWRTRRCSCLMKSSCNEWWVKHGTNFAKSHLRFKVMSFSVDVKFWHSYINFHSYIFIEFVLKVRTDFLILSGWLNCASALHGSLDIF